jgi:hypothetical protein
MLLVFVAQFARIRLTWIRMLYMYMYGDRIFQFTKVWTLVRGIFSPVTPNTMLKTRSKKTSTLHSLAYVILPRFGAFSSSSSLSVTLFFLFPVFPVAPEVLSARDNEAGTEPVGVAACDGVAESGPSCACVWPLAYGPP